MSRIDLLLAPFRLARDWWRAVRAEAIHSWEGAWQTVWDEARETWRLRFRVSRFSSRLLQAFRMLILRRPPTLFVARKQVGRPARDRPRVLHLFANLGLGGSEKVAFDLIQGLGHDYDMQIVTSRFRYFAAFHNVEIHALPPAALRRLVEKRPPDLVHVHYWGLTPWLSAAVDTIASVCPDVPILENDNNPKQAWRHPAIRHHVFVSAFVRDLQQTPVLQSSVIYPGVDTDEYAPRGSDLPADTVGLVYRLENDKLSPDSIEPLIDLAKRRPRTRFVIIGVGANLTRYVARTREEDVRANFEFVGRVAYHELPRWYDRFSLFCAPVRAESYGVVVPYAMAKNIPVAGFRVGALPELLGNDETLAASRSGLVDVLASLLDDRTRARVAGARGRDRVERFFSLRTMLEAYRDLYGALLAGESAVTIPGTREVPKEPGLDVAKAEPLD